MPDYRVEKAASFLRDELILLLRDKVKDPRVKDLTVTEVSLTPDRRIARVYVANYGTAEEMQEGLEGLKSAQGLLRREVSRLLHWNYAPQLEFRVDASWQYGQRIDALLDELDIPQEETPSQDADNEEPADDDTGD